MSFPVLNSGATVQFPIEVSCRTGTQEIRFLDGSRQVHRITGPLRRWGLRFDRLDASEAGSLAAFVEMQQGTPFVFTDPVNGDAVSNCVLRADGAIVRRIEELRSAIQLTVEELS